MASITIPYGNSSIPVEIPDFALESTQQDIVRESSETNSLLSQIASHMGVEVKTSQAQEKATDELISKIEQNNKETKTLGRTIRDGALKAPNAVGNQLAGMTGKEGMSDLMGQGGILGSIPGLANAGAMMGSMFGILEEFGASMSALRRVGAGVGVNLIELRESAAQVGLGMESLGKIVTDNGATIRSLGTNTNEGTQNFLRLNRELRNATEDLGFFGLNSTEMSAVLTDEIETRRRARMDLSQEEDDRKGLINTIKENLRMQEAMAAATGTDLADRIKAQQAFKEDSRIALLRRSMDEQQIQAMNNVTGAFTQLGDGVGRGVFEQVVMQLLSGGNIGQVDGAAELNAFLQAEGVDMLGTARAAVEAIRSGTVDGSEQIVTEFANQIAAIDNERLSTLGSVGVGGATMVLDLINSVLTTTQGAIDDAMRNLDDPANQADLDLSGTRNRMDVAAAQFRTTLMQSILNAFDIDDIRDSNFVDFVKNIQDFPASENFRNFMDMISKFNAYASGGAGIVFTMSDIGNPTNAEAAVAQAVALRNLLRGGGVDIPGADLLAGGGLATILGAEAFNTMFPDGIPTGENMEGLSAAIRALEAAIRGLTVPDPTSD